MQVFNIKQVTHNFTLNETHASGFEKVSCARTAWFVHEKTIKYIVLFDKLFKTQNITIEYKWTPFGFHLLKIVIQTFVLSRIIRTW